MPEVVTTWCKTYDYLKCTQIQNDLLLSYQDDFSKYRKRVPASRIQEVFRSVAEQGQGKFVYKKVNPDIRSEQIKTALETLILAGLVYPVTHTAANGIPLGAEVREDYRRMIYFDTGLLQRQLGLKAENILVSDDFDVINKLSEKFVPTYIKIDAEGAELDILNGGKKIISEFKPKIKIATYHKNRDIFEIPILLNKLNENYKIYMCHHPYIPAWDTDFYCV